MIKISESNAQEIKDIAEGVVRNMLKKEGCVYDITMIGIDIRLIGTRTEYVDDLVGGHVENNNTRCIYSVDGPSYVFIAYNDFDKIPDAMLFDSILTAIWHEVGHIMWYNGDVYAPYNREIAPIEMEYFADAFMLLYSDLCSERLVSIISNVVEATPFEDPTEKEASRKAAELRNAMIKRMAKSILTLKENRFAEEVNA